MEVTPWRRQVPEQNVARFINCPAILTSQSRPGTTEAGTTTTLEELINTTLHHNYSLVITAHYTEGEPRETITLHYNTTTALL